MNFESFINDFVIPENWSILSSRFNVESWTPAMQRMKIIGEIIEFYEALEHYKTVRSPLGFSYVIDELADIVISTCTLIKILDRKYCQYTEAYEQNPEQWILLVTSQRNDKLITNIEEYSRLVSIDLEGAIRRKLAYNRTRTDW
jgi:hypothetical protein